MNHIFVLGYKIKFDSIVGKYTIKSKKSFGWSHYDEIQDAIDAVEKHFFSLPQNHSAPEMLKMLKKLCYKWIEKSNGGQKLLIDDNSINQELLHLIAKAEGE